MNKGLKVGIIGTGKHGTRYAQHIINDLKGQLQLTSICRKSHEKGLEQSEQWQVKFVKDWQNLISSPDVEAVISVTTPNLNIEIANQCVQHNKPLLIEKPLATNKTDATQIYDIFTQSNVPLTIAQTLRYNPVIKSLKQELNKIGTLHSFYSNHRLEPSTLPWLDDPLVAGGGVIFQTAVHMFDALRFITGLEVKRVRASSFKKKKIFLEDLFTAQVEMQNDVFGIVEASKISPARSGRYEFVGDKGLIMADQIHGNGEFVSGPNITPLFKYGLEPSILPLLLDWSNYLLKKSENPIPANEGLAAVRICDACRESAVIDDWVSVEE